ncbi:PREDICTED: mas-related G-protein coupled receptor member B4-like [Dipodomys ordii]|uniref:Mas-related G-protein coupled receptor member B4-like n=1 Tax=Dipodomys ordii TaxID=10020 RepID=A0A1S3FG23_DIPOR|nr:PREDICTED: mas-related G-protein coupled receptor member B4-like [Dipodomys ordii]
MEESCVVLDLYKDIVSKSENGPWYTIANFMYQCHPHTTCSCQLGFTRFYIHSLLFWGKICLCGGITHHRRVTEQGSNHTSLYDRSHTGAELVELAGNAVVLWLLGFRIHRKGVSVYILNLAGANFLYLCFNIFHFMQENTSVFIFTQNYFFSTALYLILLFVILSGSALALMARLFCGSGQIPLTRLYMTILLTVLVFLSCGLPYGGSLPKLQRAPPIVNHEVENSGKALEETLGEWDSIGEILNGFL